MPKGTFDRYLNDILIRLAQLKDARAALKPGRDPGAYETSLTAEIAHQKRKARMLADEPKPLKANPIEPPKVN
jgi:hypothetical protein